MVKQGYKQTEIGVIPQDWEVLNFKDICYVNQGLQIPITERLKNYKHGSKIYITIQYLNNAKDVEYITEFNSSVVCTKKDLLMTRTGNTGYVVRNVEGVFHNNFFKINFNEKLVNKDFLYFFLVDTNTQKIIREKAGTSTIPDLNHNDFYSIQIPLPPLAEQEAIATALSDADVWIESLEQLIDKKRFIKQGAMQTLLTPPSEELVLSGVEAWEMKKLSEVLKSVGSGTSNTLSDGQSFPIYGSTGVIGFKNYYDYEGHNITVARVGANAGRVNIISGQYCVSDNTLLLVPSNEIHVKFLFYFLIKANLNNLVFGSGQPLITGGQLKVLELFLPNLCEQERIATILSDMDTELENLANQLAKARQIKQGMMQELLTGRTRLV